MSTLNLVFFAISFLLMVYMVLILIRVLATWFSGVSTPGFITWIARITDPFLNMFRGLRFLRIQYMDLSPLAALALIFILYYVATDLSMAQSIWFGRVLAIIIEVLSMSIRSVFVVFGVLALIRLIAIFAKASSVSRVWFTLDHMLQPLIYPIAARLSPRKVLPYGTGLGIFIGLNAAAWLGCLFLFNQLAYLANKIPF